jgi:transcriptional regulator with XRE-family HTH domain
MQKTLGKNSKLSYIETLLNDFVVLDCRLANHPIVKAAVYTRTSGGGLQLVAHTPGYALDYQELVIASSDLRSPRLAQKLTLRPIPPPWMLIPLPDVGGRDFHDSAGILAVDLVRAHEVGIREQSILSQSTGLLSALIAFANFSSDYVRATPLASELGKSLKNARVALSWSQEELARRLECNRITLSQWESGRQVPSRKALYSWCNMLGLVSKNKGAFVRVIDVTPELLQLLKEDPRRLAQLTPDRFEQFIAERLDRVGFDVTLTGRTTRKDGGIDLIAVPKVRTVGSFLLAGQVKHHSDVGKVSRGEVDRLLAWKDSPFRVGLLVTNTTFTSDARWVAELPSNRHFLRLRDFDDLKRWIEDNFSSTEDWHEIPDEIELAPGVVISVPKALIQHPLDLWPLI